MKDLIFAEQRNHLNFSGAIQLQRAQRFFFEFQESGHYQQIESFSFLG